MGRSMSVGGADLIDQRLQFASQPGKFGMQRLDFLPSPVGQIACPHAAPAKAKIGNSRRPEAGGAAPQGMRAIPKSRAVAGLSLIHI